MYISVQQPYEKPKDKGQVTVETGDITVTNEPAQTGVQKLAYGRDIITNYVFPEGAYRGEIVNNDPIGGVITVNGRDLNFGDRYVATHEINTVTNRQDFAPSLTVTTTGTRWDYEISYPSDSATDTTTFP